MRLVGDLDLVERPNETRAQLARLDFVHDAPGPLRVLIDLREVTDIDPCALLHLVAQGDRLARSNRVKVKVHDPVAAAARRALHEAGFDEHIAGPLRTNRRIRVGNPSLKVVSGTSTTPMHPDDWVTLHNFLVTHGDFTDVERDEVYAAFGECLENVRQHAYRGRSRPRWYALAIKPTEQSPARAVVLDIGVGIARSIRRTPIDQLRAFLTTLFDDVLGVLGLAGPHRRGRAWDDWQCVLLATHGLRTETGQRGRGAGLNGLREAVLANGRSAMHVLSGTASLTWRRTTGPVGNSLPHLRGTIVCLEIDVPQREPTHDR